jgi:hypothetical protein
MFASEKEVEKQSKLHVEENIKIKIPICTVK